MQTIAELGEVVTRAAYLLALAVAPPFLSPEPAVPAVSTATASVAALVLVTVVIAAGDLRTRIGGREGLAAAALVALAVAAAIASADVFRGERGPLGRGLLFVAVPLWAGLVVVAGRVAERRVAWRPRRRAVRGAVAIVGVVLLASCGHWLFSAERMRLAALRFDGDNPTPVHELTEAALRAKRYDIVNAMMDKCLAASPAACACLARRVEVATRAGPPAAALEQAASATQRCPSSPTVRAASAEALAFHGDAEAAEQEARVGLERGDDGRLRYVLAIALDRVGRHAEALEEAKHAVALGAGRDGALLLGSLAINAGDLDAAEEALRPVVTEDPNDADARYDLALVADRKNDFNHAREGYLAALHADPRLAAARYNLALLALRMGAVEEAKHHAERFAAAFPDDPRAASIRKTIARAEHPR